MRGHMNFKYSRMNFNTLIARLKQIGFDWIRHAYRANVSQKL